LTSDVWNIAVDSSTYPSTTIPYDTSNIHVCDGYCNHTYPYSYSWISTYQTTIYMYQIKCPSCNKMNWAQLETTIECKTAKCKAKLRAVTSKPEHIVEVEV